MQLLLCTSSIGKWFLRKIEEVKHKVSQNLSKSPHETQRVTYTVHMYYSRSQKPDI